MKLSINNITRGIRGSEGTWSKALVSLVGEAAPADVVELRSNEAAFDLMEQALQRAKARGLRLTVECEEFPFARVKGTEGVRTETFTSKTGEVVTQTELYLRLGTNPHWAIEEVRPSLGNLADLLADEDDMGDLDDLL